jgi:hypothetical protein
MRFILGIIVGAVLVYFLLGKDTGDVGKQAKDIVHNAASEVAKATEPTTRDRVKDLVDSLVK